MNRATRVLVLGVVLFLAFIGDVYADDIRQAIRDGLKDLNAKKGDGGLCAITDATYVRVNGKTSENCVDVIREETGCSVGRGNLLFFHRNVNHPLKIAVFRKDTKECLVIGYDGQQMQTRKYEVGIDVISRPNFFKEVDPPLAPDASTIATFAHVWALDAPQDFLKCAEFHNHLCPGITCGYMIARFIVSKYPLKEGEHYTWIASPLYCKDDAIQILLDLTAGKKALYTKRLTESQKKDLESENAAGILVVWNKKENKGKGVILEFNWDKARKKERLLMTLGMLPYLDTPDEFVKVVKELDVTPQMLEKLTTAEMNPYKWLGLAK